MARFCGKDIQEKVFQRLLFLIRDWPNSDQYNYGYEDSLKYLENEVLATKPTHSSDMKALRQYLRDSFDSIDCFLMPDPGPEIVNDKDFDGRWANLKEDFVTNLKTLIPNELSPEKLLKKKIAGEDVTAEMLYEAIKGFRTILNSPNVPSGGSMYRSFATGHLENLISSLFYEYKNLIEEKSETVKSLDELEKVHAIVVNDLKNKFDTTKKIGDEKLHQKYYKKLVKEIDELYNIILKIIATNTDMEELKAEIDEAKKREEKIREENEKAETEAKRELEKLVSENKILSEELMEEAGNTNIRNEKRKISSDQEEMTMPTSELMEDTEKLQDENANLENSSDPEEKEKKTEELCEEPKNFKDQEDIMMSKKIEEKDKETQLRPENIMHKNLDNQNDIEMLIDEKFHAESQKYQENMKMLVNKACETKMEELLKKTNPPKKCVIM